MRARPPDTRTDDLQSHPETSSSRLRMPRPRSIAFTIVITSFDATAPASSIAERGEIIPPYNTRPARNFADRG